MFAPTGQGRYISHMPRLIERGGRYRWLVNWAAVLLSTVSAAAAQEPSDSVDLRLVTALERQDRSTIEALLDLGEGGLDVDAARGDGVTALHLAVHRGDHAVVDWLLAAGAEVSVVEDHGLTPLALASQNGSLAMVERLLAAGASADAAQSNGVTPLMVASRTGHVGVVETLLVAGAPVNASSRARQTALMWAVSEGHVDVARVLIAAGADVTASSTLGFTPLLFTARNGDVESATLLIESGADVNQLGSDGTHALPLAIVSGRDELAHLLLSHGADPDGAMHGVRALHTAAGPVDIWLRDWLRVRGIDGVFGSPMVRLAPDRKLALVEALLERGADPNARISTSSVVYGWLTPKRGAFEPYSVGTGELRGATPLWVAAFAANRGRYDPANPRPGTGPDVVRAMLDAGADANLATEDGTTPLMAAAGMGRLTFQPTLTRGPRSHAAEAAVRVLVEAGADVNATNEAGFTALHGAAFRGLNEVLQYLVEQGADIDAQDFRGRTAYRIAEGAKQTFQFQAYPETAAFLAELGADVTLGVPGELLERGLERDLEAESEQP